MNAFVDAAEAAEALAYAASKVIQAWPYHDVPCAIRYLSCALQQYRKSRPRAEADCAASAATGSTARESPRASNQAGGAAHAVRFRTALAMVDPAAVDLSALAGGIISACAEVRRERGLPCKDPAVLLIARQIAWVCGIADEGEPFAELIAECWRLAQPAAAGPPRRLTPTQHQNQATSQEHHTMPTDEPATADRIRKLNDAFRATLQGGRFLITSGVNALGRERVFRLVSQVRTFASFDLANDPHGEHDFGAFDDGGDRFFWKIDYYDPAMEHHSDDPADPSKTVRVLTLLRAEEY